MQNHHPYQSCKGVEGSGLCRCGWGQQPVPLCTDYIWNMHIYPLSLLNNICTKKARQVVRVDWSWMDLLSLPLFFSIRQSPEASISLITEPFHLNGRLCIVRTKGRAASEEVLDRGMDWARRLGWVVLQVQASLPKKGVHSEGWGTFHTWERQTYLLQLQLFLVFYLWGPFGWN